MIRTLQNNWRMIVFFSLICIGIVGGIFTGYTYNLIQYVSRAQMVSPFGAGMFYLFQGVNLVFVLYIVILGIVDCIWHPFVFNAGGGYILEPGIVFFLFYYAIGVGLNFIQLPRFADEGIIYCLYGAVYVVACFVVDGIACLILSMSILIPYWILRYLAGAVGLKKGGL